MTNLTPAIVARANALTEDEIAQHAIDAGSHGDHAAVAICRLALGENLGEYASDLPEDIDGPDTARIAIASWVADAQAMQEETT